MSNQKGFLGGVGIAIAVVLAIALMAGGGWAWRYYTAPIEGVVEAEEQINSGSNRIAKYNYFFDMCATIQSDKEALAIQKEMLDNAESADERERIRANIAGINAQLRRNVNQYNADAGKEYTAARFKANSLPYNINANEEFVSCK